MLKTLRDFTVCQILDAVGEACTVEVGIRPLHPEFRIAGRALTVVCTANDNLTLHHALHLAKSGDVLVVQTGRDCEASLWGELMSLSAKLRGLQGTIVEGAVRDSVAIQKIGYPVFARSTTPRKANKLRYGKLNTPIRCGCLQVNPGDFILGDIDGILSIPSSRIETILGMVLEVARKEAEIREQITSGRSIFEILNLDKPTP